MSNVGKPRVYISYSWHTEGMKERAFQLAERLRAAGVDSRIDLYYAESRHGFLPPERRPGDQRDPWRIWQEDQLRNADRVLLICSPEYWESVEHPDDPSGKLSGAWYDVHFMSEDLASGRAERGKFIPVGFEPYERNSRYVPRVIEGATYYNLASKTREGFGFEDLLRRFKAEFPIQRSGVFVSYSHKDKKWLESLLEQLAFLKQKGVEVWTDQEIEPGDLWHQTIENRLATTKVAILLVTPAFLSSSYIASHELPKTLEAAKSEGLVIFWIPVKASSYQQTEISQFQAAHTPSEPLAGLVAAKRDEAFVNIAAKLAKSLGVAKLKE